MTSGHAAAAAGAGPGARLDAGRRRRGRRRRSAAQIAPLVTLLHEQTPAASGMAPTPDRRRRRRREAARRISASGMLGSRHVAARHLHEHAVGRGVADQDAAEHRAPSSSTHELLVHVRSTASAKTMLVRAGGGGEGVAEAGHVDAEQLELGGHVGAGERAPVAAEQRGRRRPRPSRSRGRPGRTSGRRRQRALADREDVAGPRCGSRSSTTTPPRSPTSRPAPPGELVAGADAGGEHDEVGVDAARRRRSAGRGPAVGAGDDPVVRGAGVRRATPSVLDAAAQRRAAAVVELHRHEPRGELDDVRLEPEAAQRVGGLESGVVQRVQDNLFRLGIQADSFERIPNSVAYDVAEILFDQGLPNRWESAWTAAR